MRRGGPRSSDSGDAGLDVGALFDGHVETVFAYVARRVGRDAAEDVTGEVFSAAVRSATTYDAERGTPIAWLMGITINVLSRHWNTERRMLEMHERLRRDPLAHRPHPSPEHSIADVDQAASVAAILIELPPADREALTLFAWADLSYADIAAVLDVPVGTVRSRIARARQRLRERLDDAHSASEEEIS